MTSSGIRILVVTRKIYSVNHTTHKLRMTENLMSWIFSFYIAEWLRRPTWVQKVPGSSPGSNIWCSCLNLLRGGAVAMVTELALNLLWKHRK